jgi:ABC-2 type transport system ATP-binding protein
MSTVEVSHIIKSFGNLRAVNDVSFAIEKGEIFGLLGPNGAGKTTIIRLMLDLFKPDSGQITILGGPMSEAKKRRIGYMPEERGLYQDVPLDRCLSYLGSLKGLSRKEVRQGVAHYLKLFDLEEHKKKKITQLSKGMQQKAQLIVTLLHQPELLIIDEPFTGLDPLNTQMVKDMLHDLREQGVTIIMSTHQMHQIEEMCNRILLINHGQTLLYGKLDEIRRQFAGHAVLVRTQGELPSIPGIMRVERSKKAHKLVLQAEVTPKQVLRALLAQEVELEYFEIATPPLSEIFVKVVQGKGK